MEAIEFDLPCAACGYNLRGLPPVELVCPECGTLNPTPPADDSASIATEADVQRRFGEVEGDLLMVLAAALLLAMPTAFFLLVLAAGSLRMLREESTCLSFTGVFWFVWASWSAGVYLGFRRRAEPRSHCQACLLRYAACFTLISAMLFGVFLVPLNFVTAPRHALTPGSLMLRLVVLGVVIAVLYRWVRPWMGRVREQLYESQRVGLFGELRGAAAGAWSPGRSAS